MQDICKVKVGDLVKRIDPTGESYEVQQGEVYEVENISGHHLRVKGSCKYYFIKSFEVVNSKPKNYRLMNQDTLIKVSIDGHEFEVPLGDLIRMQKVCGAANGKYGYTLWEKVRDIIDQDFVIRDNTSLDDGSDYADMEKSLLEEYFKPSENLKRKAEIQEALKHLNLQAEEITKQADKLHQELKTLS